MIRREKLNDIAVTMEERQTYISQAASAEASYQSPLANLDQARINLKRTQVRSPVNGYVTNLTAQLGNYADVGSLQLSLVNSDSYWVDAYFEETALGRIHEGDAATIKLMGYTPLLRGRVHGLARGIDVPNAAPDASGLASVNPIFTFVRLAQRVPVRIHIDEVPEGVKLVAGLTATVQIEPFAAPPVAAAPGEGEQGRAELATYEPEAQPQAATSGGGQSGADARPPAPPQAPGQSATAPAPQAAAPAAAQGPAAAAGAARSRRGRPRCLRPALRRGVKRGRHRFRRSQDARATDRHQSALRGRHPRPPASLAAAPPSSRRANISGRPSTSRAARASRPSRGADPPNSIRRRARSRWRHTYER